MKIILWPFKMILSLVSSVVKLTGRLIAIVLGLVLMTVGFAATFTIIGGIVGIPLIIFGFLLLVKGVL